MFSYSSRVQESPAERNSPDETCTFELTIRIAYRSRMCKCDAVVFRVRNIKTVIQYQGKTKFRSARAFVVGTMHTCMRCQLQWLFGNHNFGHRAHPSMTGAAPWHSSFGVRSYPIKPMEVWVYNDAWPTLFNCNLTTLQLASADHCWGCIGYIVSTERRHPCKHAGGRQW